MVQALALFERADGEFTLNGTTTGTQSLPKISWISATQYIAVWTHDPLSGNPDSQQIRAQIFNADGTAAGAEFTVNSLDAGAQTNAVVASLAGGGFVVAWEDRSGSDGSGYSVHYQLYGAGGSAIGAERIANTTSIGNQFLPSLAGLAGGGFVITWSDASMTGGDTSGLAVRGQLFSATGDLAGSEFLVNSVTSRGQTASNVAALPGGGFAVLWQDESPQGFFDGIHNRVDFGSDIAIQIFDSSANKVGGQQTVDDTDPPAVFAFSDTGRLTAMNPVATVLPDGMIAVAWIDNYDGYVRTRLLNADGTPATDVVDVGFQFGTLNPAPAIVALADGGYAISWTVARDGLPDASGQGVLARVFGADGSPQGVEFQVNSSVQGNQGASTMLALADGGFLVAWQDSTTTDISAQRFREDGGTISDIALSVASISRGGIENVQAAILSADGALNAPFTYQLLSDPTGAFRIEGDRLVVADTQLLYGFGLDEVTLTFRATDSNGNSYDEAIQIPLADAPASALFEAQTQELITIESIGNSKAQVPELVALPNGGYFLTWVELRASSNSFDIMGQFHGADGSPGEAPFVVNTLTVGSQLATDAALLTNGNVVVTWTGPAQSNASLGTQNDVRGQILDPLGAKVGAEFVINTVTALQQIRGVPTALADGGFLVTWSDSSLADDPSSTGIKAQIFTATATKVGGEFLVNATTAGAQTLPYAAQLASGTIVIAWTDASATGADSSGTAIHARLFSAAGAPLGGEFLVNTTTLFNQSAPVVTPLADGRFVIVWGDTSEGTGSTGAFDPADIRAQIYDADGNKVGGEILVNTETFGFQGLGSLGIPGVAADDSGGFVVTWSSFAEINSDEGMGAVKAQLFGADGGKVGSEFLVNQIGFGQQSAPAVAYLGDGDLVFAWWDVFSRTGDYYAISTRRFDSAVQASPIFGGTPGADTVSGTSAGDLVAGYGGNDILLLQQGGEDKVLGGDGNDTIYFGTALSAGDVADGGAGRDAIVLQGNVTVVLNNTNLVGIESISIQSGANTKFGDTANNFYDYDITTADGNVAAGQQLIVNAQSLRAGEDFTFNGSAEHDGKFLVYAGNGVDTLKGGDGNDIFLFEGTRWGSSDTVDGGAGRDSVVISGVNGVNHFNFAANSFTSIESISLNNHLASDPSQKPSYELVLNNGNVAAGATLIVNGSSLADPLQTVSIDGSGIHDGKLILFGGAGNDVLKGGDGADQIQGGLGADALTGGAGADIFRYVSTADSSGASTDQILDFRSGTDTIDLHLIDADSFTAGDQAFHWISRDAFSGGGAASAGELRTYGEAGTWFVEGDTNGDGIADFSITVILATPFPLQSGDLVL